MSDCDWKNVLCFVLCFLSERLKDLKEEEGNGKCDS